MSEKAKSFKPRLLTRKDGQHSQFSSVPLIIPNDKEYNSSNNSLTEKKNVTRNKVIAVELALELLSGINKPVAVLSIAGPTRSGKSYFLSRLLGSHDAFQLGHTFDPQTFGIWMGTTALECDDYVIVLLDTEGIDGVLATAANDAQLLVLTLLLSSYFIYNSLGVPRAPDLEKMSVFTKLARSIAIRKGQKTDVRELNQHFPKFMWLLRDTVLKMVDDKGKETDPTTYLLKKVLCSQADEFELNPTTEETVRKAIVAFFPSIKCFALPPPTADVKTMRNIVTKVHELEKGFNDGIEKVSEQLKSDIELKKAFNSGEPVDGSVLAFLTREFVEAINDPNAIPALDNTWHTVIMLKCKSAQDHLEKEYVDEMTKTIRAMSNGKPLEEDDVSEQKPQVPSTTLMGIHRNVFHKKREKLLSDVGRFLGTKINESPCGSFTKEKLLEEFEARLVIYKKEKIKDAHGKEATKMRVVGGVLYRFVQQNYEASFDYCTCIFDEQYKPIQDKLTSNDGYNFKNAMEDLKNLDEKYRHCAVGPAKWDVYEGKREMLENDKTNFKRLSGYKANAMKAAEDAAHARIQNDRLGEELKMVQHQMEEDAKAQEKIVSQMKEQYEENYKRLQEEMKERQEKEEQRYNTLMITQNERLAEMARDNREAMEEQYGEMMEKMMEMMTKQQEKHTEDMRKLMETLSEKLAPPPPPSPPCVIL